MEFNPDKVRKITSEMLASMGMLEELGRLPEDEFLSDKHKIASAKYNFLVVIEGAIDLCNHIIAKNAFRVPEDYADAFRVMSEQGAFSPEFTGNLVQMARFRNRLVHIYWEVDSHELYGYLRERIQDIRKFLMEFGSFIGKEKI